MNDAPLALSLVRAHLLMEPEYKSWVPSYTKIRWARADFLLAETVGGHWRRKPMCKRSIDALACVCKQPDLMAELPGEPLVGRKRKRS